MITLKIRKNLGNAILVKFENLMDSASIKLITIIVFLISLIFSFWPWINNTFFSDNKVNLIDIMGDYIFVVVICSTLMLFMALLITRIGAQVGFEKGSRVTEILLTSITKSELYISHIISSIMVFLTILCIVCVPIIAAAIISDPNVVMILDQLDNDELIIVLTRIIIVSIQLIILAVAITSKVTRSEDTGPYLLLVLIPFILSNSYFAIESNLYEGILYFLNYIPMFSLLPTIGLSISATLEAAMGIRRVIVDIAFVFIFFIIGKKVFNKNISLK